MFGIGISLLSRSLDYLTGDTFPHNRQSHEVTSPEIWGIACAISGSLMVTAAFSKNWKFPYFAGIVSFAVYLMVAVQIFDARMLPYPWPPEDHRIVVDLLVYAYLSLVLSITIQYRESVKAKKKQIVNQVSEQLNGGAGG